MKSTPLNSAKATAASRSDDRQLGLGHLQLSERAFNRCTGQGCRTIADVEAPYALGDLTSEIVGEKVSDEVGSALETFRKLINEEGQVDWEAFRVARPAAIHRVTITSHRFEHLAPSVLNSKIEILHLRKAMLGLESAGLRTVGRLIKAATKALQISGASDHAQNGKSPWL